MDSCCTNCCEPIYSPAMMTPPPEDPDCNLEVRPPTQTWSFREPPTPESLPRVSTFSTPTRRQSSVNTCQPRRRSTTSDSVFSPREPLELLRERDYIGMELQKQSDLKRDLIRQYSLAEDNFNRVSGVGSKKRRHARKKLSKLRGLLNEAGNAERTLAIRWSELCLELRSHETWAQAHWERQAVEPPEYFTLSPLSITQDPSWVSEAPEGKRRSLDATSPEFVPRGMSIDDIIASGSQRSLETVEEAGEEATAVHEQASEDEWEPDEDFEDAEEQGSQRRCSYDDGLFSLRERRLSLP